MTQVSTSRLFNAVAATAIVGGAVGCGGYGEVSPAAYEYAKTLYSITNRETTAKLDDVSERIEAAQEARELSESES
ncbi:MAG: hypothetical protein AAF961_16795, partial [Planctomycetota bacterium]